MYDAFKQIVFLFHDIDLSKRYVKNLNSYITIIENTCKIRNRTSVKPSSNFIILCIKNVKPTLSSGPYFIFYLDAGTTPAAMISSWASALNA